MIFFTINPILNKKIFLGGGGEGLAGRGRVSFFFFTQNPNLKRHFVFFGGGGGVGGGRRGDGCVCWGVDGWIDEQAQTKLPLQLLRRGGMGWGRGGVEGVGGKMDGQMNRPKPICPFNFFEVWGITMH